MKQRLDDGLSRDSVQRLEEALMRPLMAHLVDSLGTRQCVLAYMTLPTSIRCQAFFYAATCSRGQRETQHGPRDRSCGNPISDAFLAPGLRVARGDSAKSILGPVVPMFQMPTLVDTTRLLIT